MAWLHNWVGNIEVCPEANYIFIGAVANDSLVVIADDVIYYEYYLS